jgi:hypothetical protein
VTAPFKTGVRAIATIHLEMRAPRMTMTLPSTVIRDLHRLVESEELGTSLFTAAADHARTDEHRKSWQALRDLEIQTNTAVAEFIQRSGLDLAPRNKLAEIAGAAAGTGLWPLPYGLQLRAVRTGTIRYLPAFRRLAEHYRGTGEALFFDYVVQHELAIIDFANNSLAGAREPLDAVTRLLDQGAPAGAHGV